MKTRLFISDSVPNVPLVFLICIQKGIQEEIGQTLFTNIPPRTFEITSYEFVSNITDADYVLFPHAIKSKKDPLLANIPHALKVAQAAGKQLIVCVGSDLSHDIFLDDVIVLKGLQYRSLKRPNEIIAPCMAEDFGDTMSITPRSKSERPVVSFCGWAGFTKPLSYAKYLARILALDVRVFLSGRTSLVVFKKGLYWRRKALRMLARDPRIDTHFIVRKSFSANMKTISLDPATARREYVENMYNSDFVLAPKGDGNSSVRFYEAISMGRIPIVIDTDMVFPLEDFINYDDFILRVSYKDIDRLADIVADFYANLSEEKFIAMQNAARAAYEQYLRYDAFLNTLFTRVLPPRNQI
jgi:hypothetical protein